MFPKKGLDSRVGGRLIRQEVVRGEQRTKKKKKEEPSGKRAKKKGEKNHGVCVLQKKRLRLSSPYTQRGEGGKISHIIFNRGAFISRRKGDFLSRWSKGEGRSYSVGRGGSPLKGGRSWGGGGGSYHLMSDERNSLT